jgi:ribosomal protein S18 acetylase RimI-like enzyme
MVVARVASQSQSSFRGARLFDPVRDLGAVARLLEEAFRPDHNFPFSDVPWLRDLGIFLWTLGYAPGFPDSTTGFVWVEDGRIVGNVTLSPDEGRLDRYMITNVAVKPNYRRQGIAHALMQRSIEHLRTLNAKVALLNVRPNNYGAIKLYADLGFQQVETRGEWMRAQSRAASPSMWHPIAPRPIREADHPAVSELVRAATPANAHKLVPARNDFDITWDERMAEAVGDFFIGQVTNRWVLEMDLRLAAVLLVRAQRLATPHRVSVEIHPDFRGRVESDLIAFALRELARFPSRAVRAYGTSTHREWIEALEQNGFKMQNALMLMTMAL